MTTSIQHHTGSQLSAIKYRHKSQRNKKKDTELLLFAENVIIYVENPEEATGKLFELISKFSNFA